MAIVPAAGTAPVAPADLVRAPSGVAHDFNDLLTAQGCT